MNENNKIKNLEALKVEVITKYSDIEKLINFSALENGDDSKIVSASRESVILFDTPTYNSEYLSDIIINFLSNYNDVFTLQKFYDIIGTSTILSFQEFNILKQGLKSFLNNFFKFYYCHDEIIYQKVFDKYYASLENFDIDTNNILVPTILFVSPMLDDIIVDSENISPLTEDTILKYLILSYTTFARRTKDFIESQENLSQIK